MKSADQNAIDIGNETVAQDRRWMTPLLNRFADIIGLEGAIAIGRAKAGQQICIPKKAPPGHWLCDLIGADAAEKMCAEFCDIKFVIPAVLSGAKRQRAMAIAEMVEQGLSLNEIVMRTGLSRSTVRVHVQRYRHGTA